MNTHTDKKQENKKQSVANAISTNKKHSRDDGLQLEDNRMHPKIVTQLQGVIQRKNPVGTGKGTDDDRNSIEVEPLVKDEKIDVKGDKKGRALIYSDFIVNEKNFKIVKREYEKKVFYVNNVLKHYMVVTDGASKYQFPIKHLQSPKETKKWSGEYEPNKGELDKSRGGQPEGFGGNTDIKKGVEKQNQSLESLRDETLNKEYQEENLNHNDATLTFGASKKFGSQFGAGTLTITKTDEQLKEGALRNQLKAETTKNRGEAEMAGTVVIDCSDLVKGDLKGNDLEHAIADKLQMLVDGIFKKGKREGISILEKQGGILAYLIGMVAEDIELQRGIKKEDESEEKGKSVAGDEKKDEDLLDDNEEKAVDEIIKKVDEASSTSNEEEDSSINKEEISSIINDVVDAKSSSKSKASLQKDSLTKTVTSAVIKFISNPVVIVLITAIIVGVIIYFYSN